MTTKRRTRSIETHELVAAHVAAADTFLAAVVAELPRRQRLAVLSGAVPPDVEVTFDAIVGRGWRGVLARARADALQPTEDF